MFEKTPPWAGERYGLDKMIRANTEFQNEEETIEDLTGKTMKVLRDEWIS